MIKYDISTEMTNRIVEEARDPDKANALKKRLNLVVYELTDGDCYSGVHHLWEENNIVYVRCLPDTSQKFGSSWGSPFKLTSNNAKTFLTRNCINDSPGILYYTIIYSGEKEPMHKIVPEDNGISAVNVEPLTHYFPSWVHIQESKSISPNDILTIIKNIFQSSWS